MTKTIGLWVIAGLLIATALVIGDSALAGPSVGLGGI